jgi:hypothetical protein
MLPRVTEETRELIAREFDTRGPDVCTAEVVAHLKQHNPELLDMATRCAADIGDSQKVMLGFAIFFRLLVPRLPTSGDLSPLPAVSEETRARLVQEIDTHGTETFTMEAIAEFERSNPELLQMAHNFATRLRQYLLAMQGFALIYRALVLQCSDQRARLH